MSIYDGSILRVMLPPVDRKEDGTTTPLTPEQIAEMTIKVVRPGRSEVDDPTIEIDGDGVPYWESVVTQGWWRIEGESGGVKSQTVRVYVEPSL